MGKSQKLDAQSRRWIHVKHHSNIDSPGVDEAALAVPPPKCYYLMTATRSGSYCCCFTRSWCFSDNSVVQARVESSFKRGLLEHVEPSGAV
jgi:hypothetical protein